MKYKVNLEIEFRKNPFKGTYIAFEGIDGCGKTTQAEELNKYLAKSGRIVTSTCEPRVDLAGGEIIMRYFKSELKLSAMAFQYFATANRVVNHEQIVIPAIKKGNVVLTDRCFWSAVPYGLMDLGVNLAKKNADLLLFTQSLLSKYHQFIKPDLVFYIDIDHKTGMERSLKKKNRRKLDIYEKEEKLRQVVGGYRWLIKQFPDEFITIDGERKVAEITDDIVNIIKSRDIIRK